MSKTPLYQQLARSLSMRSNGIAKAAVPVGETVHFPSLQGVLGKAHYGMVIDPLLDPLALIIDPKQQAEWVDRFNAIRDTLPEDRRAYFVLFILTAMERYCMYEGFSYEGQGGLLFTLEDEEDGHVMELWDTWFKRENR